MAEEIVEGAYNNFIREGQKQVYFIPKSTESLVIIPSN